MTQVIQEAVRLLSHGEPFVLATVVRTIGSTPQYPGAQIIVQQGGKLYGTIGGGCVEGDVWQQAQKILQSGSGAQLREYVLNEDIAMRDGLVCGGTMYLFLEPIRSGALVQPLLEEVLRAYMGGTAVVLATLVTTAASSSVQAGSKIVVHTDGTAKGSLGAPYLDQFARETAQLIFAAGGSRYAETTQGDALFLTAFVAPPSLVLLGGGHIGKAVARIAATLGFGIHVVDNRQQFANKERFPEAETTIVCDFASWTDHLAVTANSFIVIATSGHKSDDLALETALRTPARYIGMIGSKRKSQCLCRHMLERGIAGERVGEVRTPVGLDIGAVSPEEIAVSIMAEIILERHGGTGRPLRMDFSQTNISS